MVPQQKVFEVENLVVKLKEAKMLVLADYRGLKVSQINDLRNKVKKAGAEFEVVKNTLLARASTDAKVEIDEKVLREPTAAFWLYQEDFSPLKILTQFIKENSIPKIKFGLFDQEPIDSQRINQIATLPTMDELKAKLVGLLSTPAYRLVNACNWNLRKLVFILKSKGGEQHG